MLRRIVHANNRNYLFSPDDTPAFGTRIQAIVQLRVVDEITRRAPDSQVVIESTEKRLTARVAQDGVCGLVGIPLQVFPGLQTIPYNISFTISADSYLPVTLTANFPFDNNFPNTFTPQILPDVLLHRAPTVITGRTMQLSNNTPMAGATVSVLSMRRRPRTPTAAVPPDPPNLVALQPPLYTQRPQTTTLIQQRDLVPAATPDKVLVEDLQPGANPILLSDRVGLSSGDVLLIDEGEPDLAEFILIKTVPATNPPDQPALITLEYPLINAHRRNAVVRLETPQPAGLQQQFTVDAIPGDACVFLDGVTALATAQQVQIIGPGTPDEFHGLRRFSTLSDANGYYRLPPLSRVAEVEVRAERIIGPQTFTATETLSPDYRLRENRLDLRLRV
jgi:hypothetical protein